MKLSRSTRSYLTWLLNRVGMKGYSIFGDKYQGVMEALWDTPFVCYPHVKYEDNVLNNAKSLREQYEKAELINEETEGTVTMLEVMIDLSERMYRYIGGNDFPPLFYFTNMLGESGLIEEKDGSMDPFEVRITIDYINSRAYDFLGHGGFFPLVETQTKDYLAFNTDMWTQMRMYYNERMPLL